MINLSSFQILVFKNYIYGIFGVISGLTVNTISVIIMKLLNLKNNEILIRILIQLLLCSITLAVFENFLLKDVINKVVVPVQILARDKLIDFNNQQNRKL